MIRILDLFCGAGGVAMGLHRALDKAGVAHVIFGVDNKPQPNYPFEFIQGDAIEIGRQLLVYSGLHFDFVWASPPCQSYSFGSAHVRARGKSYPDFLVATRELLQTSGKPYMIENVTGAPLRYPVRLCGTMFGLKVFRHRLFESNLVVEVPSHGRHANFGKVGRSVGDYQTVAGHGADGRNCLEAWAPAMGIDWMTKTEITQAIPPAYSEYLMAQVLEHLLLNQRAASSSRAAG